MRTWARTVSLTLATAGCWGGDDDAREGAQTEAPAPNVFLAILDTVRADHTSLCGYGRPTTPTLDALAEQGATHTCHAYSPAPWTHPAHASLFTGLPVPDHGAIWVTDSAVAINPVTKVRPLHPDFVTLAEQLRDRGYQTVAVSANIIVTQTSGLLQGFDTVVVSPTTQGLRGRSFRPAFRQVVKDLDPDKPLFLFLNLYDAHDPYPPIPANAPWAAGQDRLHLHPNQHDPSKPYYRYVKGLSDEAEAAPFLEQVVDGYDWGVREADANLGFALGLLARKGFLDGTSRLAVTSDHGEMLGEHQLLRHGGYLYEGMVNVPLVYRDYGRRRQPPLIPPVSTMVVHSLLLDGTMPDVSVSAVAEQNEQDVLVGVNSAAVWDGRRKGVVTAEGQTVVDLKTDPGEEAPTPVVEGEPLASALEARWGEVEQLLALPAPEDPDGAWIEALKAVGYVE